jgi:Protein of unknown function (DUF3108)
MRKLGCFVALSLIAHLLIIYGVPLQLPQRTAEPLLLEARLQPAAPLPPVSPRPARQPVPKSATEPVVKTLTAAPQVTAAPILTPEAQPIPEPAAVEAPSVAPSAAAEDKPAPLLARRLPQNGEIAYALYLGSNKFNVGRTMQTWTIKDDRYRLTNRSETTGLAALFSRQSLDYVSTGRLTASGLRPEFFGTERLRSGKTEAASAKFDWDAQTLTYGEPPRSAVLPANAQDVVSFMYQLGLLPLTPGRLELPITNGWKLERYELEVGSEELLQTPFGPLRAVPVTQVHRPGEESIELWLAPDYRWLPVRIRFFDRDGEPSGEQLVSEIRVSAD